MKFSEYIALRDQEVNEGWWDKTKGAIAGVGHVPLQFARGLGNTAYGLGQGGIGAAQTAYGLGAGDWGTVGRGVGRMARGVGNTIGGVTQAATSPLAGLGRGVMAAYQPGLGKPAAQPGAWGSFKQFMGWNGAPQAGGQVQPPPATQAIPNPYTPMPQVQPTASPQPQSTGPASQATPMSSTNPRPQLTPQQKAFFRNNPNFNKAGRTGPQTSPQEDPVPSPQQPQNPSNVQLRYGQIAKLLNSISMQRKVGSQPLPSEMLLKTLQSYSRNPNQNNMDWKTFANLCLKSGIDPQKLYDRIA